MKYIFLLLLGTLLMLPTSAKAKILYETDSLYHHIVVRENSEGKRFLSFNRVRGDQSAVLPGHPEVLTYGYTKTAFVALCFLEKEPKQILYIGVGAGTMPAYTRLVYPRVQMDLVEIDPEVTRVAKEYFDFKLDANMRESAADGRVFLRGNTRKYDFIFLDAYNDSSVPFHLTTKEFLQLCKEHLAPNGVLASNVWSQEMNRYFNAQVNTYKEVFGDLHLFQSKGSGNYIFVVTNHNAPFSKEILERRAKTLNIPAGSLNLNAIIQQEYMPPPKVNEEVLTDDFAPVNILRYAD